MPFSTSVRAALTRLGSAPRTVLRTAGQAGVLVALVGGTVAFAANDTTVELTVDGETTQVQAFGRTVEAVLDAADVTVGPRDLVAPAVDAAVRDGAQVVVRHGRQVDLTVDGESRTFWTTALSVDEVLADMDVRADGAWLSASRSAPVGRAGLDLEVVTPKAVNVLVDGAVLPATSTATSVQGLLDELGVVVDAADRVSVPVTTPLVPGLLVSVTRITTPQLVESVAIDTPLEERTNDTMFTDETNVLDDGAPGVRTVTYTQVLADGVEVGRTLVSDVTTTEPVTRVVEKGTQARPVAPAAPASPSGAAPTTPSFSGDGSVWDALAQCESGGNWAINTGNGYYGGLQFNAATWRSNGGAGLPHENSREQQIAIAENVRAGRGFSPWPACARKLGLL